MHDQAYVCGLCVFEVCRALETVVLLAGEAEATVARLDRAGDEMGAQDDPPEPEPAGKATNALTPQPLPYRPSAADRYDAAAGELVTWLRHAYEQQGQPLPVVRQPCRHQTCQSAQQSYFIGPQCPDSTAAHPLAVVAQALIDQLDWLRKRPEADEALGRIADACAVIEHVVDRRTPRWYAGECEAKTMQGVCGRKLYPAAGTKVVRCECGAQYDPDDRKRALLDKAQDIWATAARCAHYLTSVGLACTPEMVRGYAHRGRLAPHPDPDPMGYPRYRLGSVRDLILDQQAEQRERAIRAAIRAAELAERRARKAAATAS